MTDLRQERGEDLHGLGAAVRRQRDLLVHLGILHLAVGRRRAKLPVRRALQLELFHEGRDLAARLDKSLS